MHRLYTSTIYSAIYIHICMRHYVYSYSYVIYAPVSIWRSQDNFQENFQFSAFTMWVAGLYWDKMAFICDPLGFLRVTHRSMSDLPVVTPLKKMSLPPPAPINRPYSQGEAGLVSSSFSMTCPRWNVDGQTQPSAGPHSYWVVRNATAVLLLWDGLSCSPGWPQKSSCSISPDLGLKVYTTMLC